MDIEFDRRHAFYFDTDNQIRTFCAYRLDRLWRGEPDAAMPELAGQRVRFAVLYVERFSKPPRVVFEYYPVLTFDANGNLNLELQLAQLQADVDHLEATGYATVTTTSEPHEAEWSPDAATRRRLIAATRPAYQTRLKTCSQLSRAEEPRPRLGYGRARRIAPRFRTSRIPWHRLHDRAQPARRACDLRGGGRAPERHTFRPILVQL